MFIFRWTQFTAKIGGNLFGRISLILCKAIWILWILSFRRILAIQSRRRHRLIKHFRIGRIKRHESWNSEFCGWLDSGRHGSKRTLWALIPLSFASVYLLYTIHTKRTIYRKIILLLSNILSLPTNRAGRTREREGEQENQQTRALIRKLKQNHKICNIWMNMNTHSYLFIIMFQTLISSVACLFRITKTAHRRRHSTSSCVCVSEWWECMWKTCVLINDIVNK